MTLCQKYQDGDEVHWISNQGKATQIYRYLCGKWIKVINDEKTEQIPFDTEKLEIVMKHKKPVHTDSL